MLFITHALPKNLHVDEVVKIGGDKPTVVGLAHEPAARITGDTAHNRGQTTVYFIHQTGA
ncbi:MAG: hypothetical protein ACK4SR_00635 [Thiobacillus sp.]